MAFLSPANSAHVMSCRRAKSEMSVFFSPRAEKLTSEGRGGAAVEAAVEAALGVMVGAAVGGPSGPPYD